MRAEDHEFLIARYADGTLDASQVGDVEALLRRDAGARAIFESYRAVDAALGAVVGQIPAPEVQWSALQDRISRQVASYSTSTTAVSTLSEEAEAQIAAYVDGSLPSAEARLVEARLEADPHARLIASEYASLERAFDTVRAEVPAVKWTALASHLSQAAGATEVDSYKLPTAAEKTIGGGATSGARRFAELHGASTAAETGVLGRIGKWASPSRMALAACLLIAGSVGIRAITGGPGGTPNNNTPIVAPINGGETPIAKGHNGGGEIKPITPLTPVVTMPDETIANVSPNGGRPANAPVTEIQIGPPAASGINNVGLYDAVREAALPGPTRSVITTGKANDKPATRPADDLSGFFR